MWRLPPAIVRRLRPAFARLVFGLASCLLVVGVLRSGARYFYCPSMEAVLAAPCCAHESDDEGDSSELEVLEQGGCCEARRLASAPSSTTTKVFELSPPRAEALLPVVVVEAPASRPADLVRAGTEARAGPPPGRRRAQLMVWNC